MAKIVSKNIRFQNIKIPLATLGNNKLISKEIRILSHCRVMFFAFSTSKIRTSLLAILLNATNTILEQFS